LKLVPLGLVVAAALALALPSSGSSRVAQVYVQFSAVGPSQLDVLPGQTVRWTNVSDRTHTITSDDRLFDSGDLPGGSNFSFTFPSVGTYRYHCTIHPAITGEIDVRRLTLDGLPTAAVPKGDRVEFDGVSADPRQAISIQRRLDGGRFTTIGQAHVAANGRWSATLSATATGDYRAISGRGASETRRLLVSDRHVAVRATRRVLHITVTPSAPYAHFLVEEYLRDRFGWWPVSSGQTDYVSEAQVRVHRPARVRVVLFDKDGWTPIATSRSVSLPRR
jgi:plastocyanin